MASPNLSELVTTTLRNRRRRLADNVTDNNALLMKLKENGNKVPFSGGRNITEELEYAENSTYKRYSGYEALDISPSDVFTAAEFGIKQAAVAVTISGREQIQNRGREQMINLLNSRIKNAERTMMNNLSGDIYSDGTADGGNQITGLQAIVADAGAGTVGGIDASSYSFWQNQTYDFSDNSLTAGPSTIQTAMNTLYTNLVRGNDRPDLIVADNTFFKYYWESLQAIQRVTDERSAGSGFRRLAFVDTEVVLDGGLNGSAPSNRMYFLNTDYLFYRPSRDRDMEPVGGERLAINQDAMVQFIMWAGNLTCSNRSLQGVILP